MIYAVVDPSGLIVNRIILDSASDWAAADVVLVPEGAVSLDIGGLYTDGTYTPPLPPPGAAVAQQAAASVTPRQARLALLSAGLLDQAQAAVDAAGGATKITWEYATTFERDNPLIAGLGAYLGLTSEQIDTLFAQAASL